MTATPHSSPSSRPSPAELRSMLGANLRHLSRKATSISALCRDLGINRTQFNRYLAGESFPRPDVLHRICDYFDVDARILLSPVEDITSDTASLINHPMVADFIGSGNHTLDEKDFPSGFYRFIRRSFMDEHVFVQGLSYVCRKDGHVFVRGYEARHAMEQQGLPADAKTREFRGAVLPQEDGVAILVSRRGAITASFNFLARIPSFENNFWVGYVTRTIRENMAGRRVERQISEYLGKDTGKIMNAARTAGFCTLEDLPPFHRGLLKPDEPFV